ncbi:MAG: hypothetical protein M3480_00195 [Verrucomicrobiota bacterium]|nr:hypothetical protein [Verrucomicrobiota bacterium]
MGEYFATALAADIDSLILFAGIHGATRHGFAAGSRRRNDGEIRCVRFALA